MLIGALSLTPGTLRLDTGAPGKFEHLVAYLGAGALLALGQSAPRQRWLVLWIIPYAGALELAQLFVPERHSRFSDFAVSAIGVVLGVIAAFGIAPILLKPIATLTNSGGNRA